MWQAPTVPDTLVTQAMTDFEGVWGPVVESPPISASDLRKWAIAVYWPATPPPIYWDETYAATTRWGGIVAPRDFNPFAWPIVTSPAAGDTAREPTWYDAEAAARADIDAGPVPGRRGMNGGQTETYGVPMLPSDVVASRSRLRNWTERETRLGLTLFVYSETEWRNKRDELIKLRVSTLIRY